MASLVAWGAAGSANTAVCLGLWGLLQPKVKMNTKLSNKNIARFFNNSPPFLMVRIKKTYIILLLYCVFKIMKRSIFHLIGKKLTSPIGEV
ncbi:MAG: hypothetical protein JG781_1609 [Peptococcaceae bacterium]|jgi:hypothetical protein|nr:hypothetical protein [Peptococcaceae bacterium]